MTTNLEANQEKVIFGRALEFSTSQEREEFVNQACGTDLALRARVLHLLECHDSPEFLPDAPTMTMQLETLPVTEKPGRTVGRYKLREIIGEGGCGIVYVAEQQEPVRRRVALKLIKLGMDTRSVVARFEAERQALAMMDHPNIAKVLDAGSTESGRPFFVMELVRGVKITEYCDKNNLNPRDRLSLFIQVCQAVQHAHQKGIIHRDLKPSNILVTLHDGIPVPKVIDFGIAKATEGRLTDATVYTELYQFIGTPAYMSPEQAEMSGLDIDTRSDIYSLGVLLYELLTGKTPFDGEDLLRCGLEEMRRTIREKEPPRPSTRLCTMLEGELTTTAKSRSSEPPKLVTLLRGDLDWIVMKCLEKDRTRRYETANGLAMDVKRYLHNEAVVARPPSTGYRFQKFIRRNKIAFAAGSVVLTALIFGLGISLWQYAGKSRAEREQKRLRQEAETKAREARSAQAEAAQQRDLARLRLYDSLLREARSTRKARQLGFRREVFDRCSQALALGTTNADYTILRREAAACLGDWVGLDPVDLTEPKPAFEGVLNPDGSVAAITRDDDRVSLRDTQTGRQLALLEVTGFAKSLRFDRNGSALYVSTANVVPRNQRLQGLHLEKWSVRADGRWVRDWMRPSSGVNWLETTGSGVVALGLTASNSHWRVVDLDLDRELARVPVRGAVSRLPIATISWDRKYLAFFSLPTAGALDAEVEVWDLETASQRTLLKPGSGGGCGLSFARDGSSLAATFRSTMVLYNTAGFNRMIKLDGEFSETSGAVHGPSDLFGVPVSQEMATRLLDPLSGAEIARLKSPQTPRTVAFSDDGRVVLITHALGARAVRMQVDREKLSLKGHHGGVPAVTFHGNGTQLVSAGKDRTLRLWDLNSPDQSRVLEQLPASGQALSLSPDGEFLVCGFMGTANLSVWSTKDWTPLRTIPASKDVQDRGTFSCSVSPNGKYLAAVGSGLRVWDFEALMNGSAVNPASDRPFIEETNGSSCATFDPSGFRLAYMHFAKFDPHVSWLLVKDLKTRQPPQLLATNLHVNYVQGHCFLPKSGALAYVTQDRAVAVIDPADGRLLRQLPAPTSTDGSPLFIANISVSPDESKFALASLAGTGVDVIDAITGKLLYPLPDETSAVWWIEWSLDSRRLAVTRANGEIAVWNLGEVEAQLAQFNAKQ